MKENAEEICWKFIYQPNVSQVVVDLFIEDFVFDFVERNNWCCGGGDTYMGMYDLDGETTYDEFKCSILNYLKEHVEVVESIVINDYDVGLDALIPIEIVKIQKDT